MADVLGAIGRTLARHLSGKSRAPYANAPTDIKALTAIIQPGDVLLVDGKLRISTAIKYLTQSTWSHAALCIGNSPIGEGAGPHFVEADVLHGVHVTAIEAYADHHLRICRPVGLAARDIDALVGHMLARLGHSYDLRNVIDLARYLCPTPPVPSGWRRRMIALGSGEPTKAICSSLIAGAFQSIRYPILPIVTQELSDDPDCHDCVRDILHIRHHSLFAPRDFDVSPFFKVLKPGLEHGFDPRSLSWADAASMTSPASMPVRA